jgi:hypothetical protein
MGLFRRNYSLKAIPHTALTFYVGCVKMWEEFAPNFGDKELDVASWQRTSSHFLLHQSIFDQEQHDCSLPSTMLFSVLEIEGKIERQPLWRNWGDRDRISDGAENPSQNTISRIHLKNGRSDGNCAYAQKGTSSWVMVANRPKVTFSLDDSTSPGNYERISYVLWDRQVPNFGVSRYQDALTM